MVRHVQLENVTAPALRHALGSVAGDLGFSELTIEGMLGHGKRGGTQEYFHIEKGLRLPIECASAKIAESLDGNPSERDAAASLKEAYESLAA